MQALYEDTHDLSDVFLHLKATYPAVSFTVEPVPEQDWELVCRADFKPQRFGERLWICPSWLLPPDPTAINLTLDPGLAFGTGTHPTTSLCLTWLEQADLVHRQVIDYGCGSGILAIAALKLGADHVDAVDLDEQALISTRSNALLNGFSTDELTVSLPTEVLQPVDVLMANILLTPLLQLQDAFHGLLKSTGLLVVSGILNEQVDSIIKAYKPQFSHEKTVSMGDWSLVVFAVN